MSFFFKTGFGFVSAARLWSTLFRVSILTHEEKNATPFGKIVLPGPYRTWAQNALHIMKGSGHWYTYILLIRTKYQHRPNDLRPSCANSVCSAMHLQRTLAWPTSQIVFVLRCTFNAHLHGRLPSFISGTWYALTKASFGRRRLVLRKEGGHFKVLALHPRRATRPSNYPIDFSHEVSLFWFRDMHHRCFVCYWVCCTIKLFSSPSVSEVQGHSPEWPKRGT